MGSWGGFGGGAIVKKREAYEGSTASTHSFGVRTHRFHQDFAAARLVQGSGRV
jgi:hypothetical protein